MHAKKGKSLKPRALRNSARAHRLATASGLALAVLAPSVAAAQQADVITVTATKREESVQDVSLSIATVSGDLVASRGMERLSQISDYVPNVTIAPSDEPARNISIRGLGSGNNRGFETSVGVYLDGAYLGRELFLTDAIFDIERFEIVKGPQGALFGNNTIAGAISVVTASPTDEFEAEISANAGSQNRIGTDIMVSGPLSETVSGRLYVQYFDRDGFYTNTFTGRNFGGRESLGARGKLRWEPTDTFDAEFTLSYSDIQQDGLGVQPSTSVPCVDLGAPAGCIPGLVVSLFASNPLTMAPGALSTVDLARLIDPQADGVANDTVSISAPARDARSNLFFGTVANWDVGDHTLTYSGSYAEIFDSITVLDADHSPADINTLENREDYTQHQHELRVLSPAGQVFEYLGGLYYFRNDISGQQRLTVNQPFPGPPQGLSVGTVEQESTTLSAFAQGTFNISDQLRLIAGVRQTHVEKDAPVFAQDSDPTLFIFPDYSERLSYEDDATLFNAAVEYDLTDDVMVYGSFAQGFKAGGFNHFALELFPDANADGVADNLVFQAEESDGYEIGVKSTLAGGAVTLNVVGFFTEFDNLQVSTLVGNSLDVGNAATAETRGIEVELNWAVTDAFTLAASAALLDATFTDYADAPCTAAQVVALVANVGPFAPCTQDLSGTELEMAPDTSASLIATYETALSDWGYLTVSGDVIYSGDYFPYNSGTANPVLRQDGYVQFNAMMRFDSADDAWSLALRGTNLTDERIIMSSAGIFQFPGSNFANLAPLRQWSVEVSRRF